MSETENGNGQAPAKTGSNKVALQQLLTARKGEIEQLAGALLSSERLIRMTILNVGQSPYLAKCSLQSVVASVLHAARMGLEPDGEMAALVPMNSQRNGWEAQLWPMAKGLCARAYDDTTVAAITPRVIREGEVYEVDAGSTDRLVHRPDRACVNNPVIAAYCILKMRGEVKWDLMWREEIDAIMRKSPAARAGAFTPWQSHWEEMAKKTVVKRLLKTAPVRSPRLAAAAEVDNENHAIDVIDVQPEPDDKPKAGKRAEGIKDKLKNDAPKTPPEPKPEPPASSAPKLITEEQKTRLLNLCDRGGARTPDARLAIVSSLIGHEVQAIGALTEAEALEVIDVMSGAKEARRQEAERVAAGEDDPAMGDR